MYQLHWPERATNYFGQRSFQNKTDNGWVDNILSVIEKLNSFIKLGKIRCYGLSNETPWGVHKFLSIAKKNNLDIPVSIQNPYNLLNRSFETGLSEMSIREKIVLLAYSPMAFGLLSGKYHLGTASKESRINKFPQMNRYNAPNTRIAAGQYIDIARKAGISPAKLALAFVSQQEFVTSTIIGATKMSQLKENIESIDIRLTEEVLKEIDNVQDSISNPAP